MLAFWRSPASTWWCQEEISPRLVNLGKQLAPICHLCGTYIYFAIFGLGWLKPLHDRRVEICPEKCSAGLAAFHTPHSSAVLVFDGQEDQVRMLMSWICSSKAIWWLGSADPLACWKGYAWVCRDAGGLRGQGSPSSIWGHADWGYAAKRREACLTLSCHFRCRQAFCRLLNGVKQRVSWWNRN